jgi:hypothetical protein
MAKVASGVSSFEFFKDMHGPFGRGCILVRSNLCAIGLEGIWRKGFV